MSAPDDALLRALLVKLFADRQINVDESLIGYGHDDRDLVDRALLQGFRLMWFGGGYVNRIQSSRRLEREAQRNVELMWLTGRLAPERDECPNLLDVRLSTVSAQAAMHDRQRTTCTTLGARACS